MCRDKEHILAYTEQDGECRAARGEGGWHAHVHDLGITPSRVAAMIPTQHIRRRRCVSHDLILVLLRKRVLRLLLRSLHVDLVDLAVLLGLQRVLEVGVLVQPFS